MSVVSPATEADIPALSNLLSILFAQEAEFKPDHAAQSKGLGQIIRNPELGAVLVGREGGNIVGMVNLLYTVSTALGERVALLEDMVVAPEARGSGVGSEILSQAIAYARQQGCKRITLLTDSDNLAAQRFYVRHGFGVSSMLPLRLALD